MHCTQSNMQEGCGGLYEGGGSVEDLDLLETKGFSEAMCRTIGTIRIRVSIVRFTLETI